MEDNALTEEEHRQNVASRRNSQPAIKNVQAVRDAHINVRVMRMNGRIVPSNTSASWDPSGREPASTEIDMIKVSSSLGSVYLGEVFRACISINHKVAAGLLNCSVRIEMQTPSKKQILYLNGDAFDFKASETKDFMVEHRLAETGSVGLVVYISHDVIETNSNNVQNTVPKMFKQAFNLTVASPFSIKTKVHGHARSPGTSFVEANLMNATQEPIVLEDVRLASYANYEIVNMTPATFATTTTLNEKDDTPVEAKREDDIVAKAIKSIKPLPVIHPQETCAYLFQVTELKRSRQSELGQLVIDWRHSMSAKQTTKSRIIFRQLKPRQFFTLEIISAPAQVTLENPFSVVLRVSTSTTSVMDLRLQILKDRAISILPHGLSSFHLGTFQPFEFRDVTIQMMPLCVGVQALGKFRLSCPQSGKYYDFADLHDVVCVNSLTN